MNLRVLLTVALLCASTAAPAKKYERPMPLSQQLPVELMMTQQEIAVDVPDPSAAASQFGLIGALVGAAIANAQAQAAEKRAAEVRNLLVDYRFNPKFEAALRAKLASEGISPSPQLVVRDTPWDAYSANRPQALQESAAAGAKPPTGLILSLSPRYALSTDLQTLYVRLSLAVIERSAKANGKYKDRYLFWRNYTFNHPLPTSGGIKAETNMRRWTEVGSAEVQRRLDVGIEQVTDMFVYDFSQAGRSEGAVKVNKEFGEFKGQKTTGRQIRAGEAWYWSRVGKGYLEAIVGTYPVEEAPAMVPTGPLIDVTQTAAPTAAAPAPAATGDQR